MHFDAHTDLREEYMGEEMSHSAVIRHISKFVKPENIKQVGIPLRYERRMGVYAKT